MSSQVQISVAICTRNRAESLARTLDSISQADTLLGTGWELVVVNNGSTDGTSEVIARFRSCLPIREEREENAGLSHARNRAIDSVTGDYIVWTDDDVRVDQNWLTSYAEAFARWPDAAVFGGKVLPVLEEPVPEWFRDNLVLLRNVVAFRDFGDQPLPLSVADERIPYGANYAVRMVEQRAHRYDPALGVGPGQSRLGEETTVILAILAAGGSGMWVPGATVYHQISRARLTRKYVGSYFQASGETTALLQEQGDGPMWHGAPRWLWKRVAVRAIRYKISQFTRPSPVWLREFTQLHVDLGALRFWRSASAKRKLR